MSLSSYVFGLTKTYFDKKRKCNEVVWAWNCKLVVNKRIWLIERDLCTFFCEVHGEKLDNNKITEEGRKKYF